MCETVANSDVKFKQVFWSVGRLPGDPGYTCFKISELNS